MADTRDHSPRVVQKPCTVEAIGDEVIVECGSAAATLTGDVAIGAGELLQQQGRIARDSAPAYIDED